MAYNYEILDVGIYSEMLSNISTSDLEDWEDTLNGLDENNKLLFVEEFIKYIQQQLIERGER